MIAMGTALPGWGDIIKEKEIESNAGRAFSAIRANSGFRVPQGGLDKQKAGRYN
jgi:hypothetical protein